MFQHFTQSRRVIVATVVCSLFLIIGPASAFQAGDEVKLTRDEVLRFRDEEFRQGKTDEKFTVLAHRPEIKKVFLSTSGKSGEQIAVSVSEDAVALVPLDLAKVHKDALTATNVGKFADALKLIDEALRSHANDAGLRQMRAAVVQWQSASDQLRKAQDNQKRVVAEAAKLRKNAGVADRPNPLNPADTSNHQRAEAMRDQADRLEQAGKAAIENAQSALTSAKDSLAVLGEKKLAYDRGQVTSPPSKASQKIIPQPGVELTAREVAQNKAIEQREEDERRAEAERGREALKQWTDDPPGIPEFATSQKSDPSFEQTLEFINAKLKSTGRRIWFGERARMMILTDGFEVVVFDPAACDPEVTYGTKQEEREHARYPLAGSGLPPIMDRYTVDHSTIQIGCTDGREAIQFFRMSGRNSKGDKLFLHWETPRTIESTDLKKLANAFSHLITIAGGRKGTF